jgi:hypothetical protein
VGRSSPRRASAGSTARRHRRPAVGATTPRPRRQGPRRADVPRNPSAGHSNGRVAGAGPASSLTQRRDDRLVVVEVRRGTRHQVESAATRRTGVAGNDSVRGDRSPALGFAWAVAYALCGASRWVYLPMVRASCDRQASDRPHGSRPSPHPRAPSARRFAADADGGDGASHAAREIPGADHPLRRTVDRSGRRATVAGRGAMDDPWPSESSRSGGGRDQGSAVNGGGWRSACCRWPPPQAPGRRRLPGSRERSRWRRSRADRSARDVSALELG